MEPPYVQQQATFTVDRSALMLLAFATVMVLAGLFVLLSALPPEATIARATPTRPAAALGTAEDGTSWAGLTDAHRATLRPLRQLWPELDPPARQRWLRMVAHVHGLEADATVRVHARMAAWATLSPEQRGAARLRYVQAGYLPAAKRVQLWNLYRRMPKRVVPSDPVESRLTVVAPAVVRIGPGATTMLMTEWPASRPGSATSAETSTGPN
jgi:hypothetical protein